MHRLLFLLLLTACVTVAEPKARIFDARPLEPEIWYEELYTRVRRCAESFGKASDVAYSDIEWFVVKAGNMDTRGRTPAGDGTVGGLSSVPSRIYIDERFVIDPAMLSHELGHAVIDYPYNQHENEVFLVCTNSL